MGDADQTGPDGDVGATASGDDELFQSREDGQLHFIKETAAHTFPVTAPVDATPLEEDEPEGVIPPQSSVGNEGPSPRAVAAPLRPSRSHPGPARRR